MADDEYAVPTSMPSGNPPAPADPFPARPNQWEATPTAESHIVAHGAFDAMNAAPEVTGVGGDAFKPLTAR